LWHQRIGLLGRLVVVHVVVLGLENAGRDLFQRDGLAGGHVDCNVVTDPQVLPHKPVVGCHGDVVPPDGGAHRRSNAHV
jgi:hypothetical protein